MPQFADVRILTVLDATLYRITISGSNHDFTSGAGTTTTLIRNGLIAAVNAGPQPVRAYAYTADRLLIVPTSRTNTRTYAVNSAVNLGLTVGYDTVLARRTLVASVIIAIPVAMDVFPTCLNATERERALSGRRTVQ